MVSTSHNHCRFAASQYEMTATRPTNPLYRCQDRASSYRYPTPPPVSSNTHSQPSAPSASLYKSSVYVVGGNARVSDQHQPCLSQLSGKRTRQYHGFRTEFRNTDNDTAKSQPSRAETQRQRPENLRSSTRSTIRAKLGPAATCSSRTGSAAYLYRSGIS